MTLSDAPSAEEGMNCLKGKVSRVLDTGTVLYVTLEVPPSFTCQISRAEYEKIKPEEGKDAYLVFSPSSVHVF
jgi:molybdopterin-binding protein